MRLRLIIAAFLIAAGILGLFYTKPPEKQFFLSDACRTPVRLLGSSSPSAPTAIIFHGLGASAADVEALGQFLAESGWRVYLPDLAGHGRSSKKFSYARVHECAASAVEFLYRSGQIVPSRSIFVGHSLGAAVAVGLARTLPVAATVAISPALLVPPKRSPSNLLIFAGQFDLGPVKTTARQLFLDAGGLHDQPRDFQRGHAAAFFVISGELHGAMVFDPRVWRKTLAWGDRAVGRGATLPMPASAARPLAALTSNFLLLVGMALVVSSLLTFLAILFNSMHVAPGLSPAHGAGSPRGAATPGCAPFTWKSTLLCWAIAAYIAVSAVGLLHLARLLRPVELENGDWVALVALFTGILLLFLLGAVPKRRALWVGVSTSTKFPRQSGALESVWRRVKMQFHATARELLVASISAIVVVILFSLAARPELIGSSLSFARLWRWAVLTAFTFPYFLAEEIALGPPDRGASGRGSSGHGFGRAAGAPQSDRLQPPRSAFTGSHTHSPSPAAGRAGASRFVLFLAMRGLVWSAAAYAALAFWPSALLIVLMAIGLALVAIGQRLACDALRRRGAGVPAAALLGAILAAGTLALILPLVS
jgi:pimeloyl-ACP methyl ester carboxylesterase